MTDAASVYERNDLAGSLHGQGGAKASDGDLAGAIADYDAAIGIREAIRAEFGEAWPVTMQFELASVLHSRGLARAACGDLAAAIADYDAAIKIRDWKAHGIAPTDTLLAPMYHDLALMLEDRGHAKAKGGDFAGAVIDYDGAIEMMEPACGQDDDARPAMTHQELVAALQNPENMMIRISAGDGARRDHLARLHQDRAVAMAASERLKG